MIIIHTVPNSHSGLCMIWYAQYCIPEASLGTRLKCVWVKSVLPYQHDISLWLWVEYFVIYFEIPFLLRTSLEWLCASPKSGSQFWWIRILSPKLESQFQQIGNSGVSFEFSHGISSPKSGPWLQWIRISKNQDPNFSGLGFITKIGISMTPQENEGITLQINLKKICPKIPNPKILHLFKLLYSKPWYSMLCWKSQMTFASSHGQFLVWSCWTYYEHRVPVVLKSQECL